VSSYFFVLIQLARGFFLHLHESPRTERPAHPSRFLGHQFGGFGVLCLRRRARNPERAPALERGTGIRMWQGFYQFQGGWPIVKIVCWLALSACAGVAYRRREKAGLWIVLSLIFALIALVMVYIRPF
jgi:hypothetical protein